jgi:hypothetical protein
MMIESSYTCAFCGETIATSVDPSGGRNQSYTEDCQVCCRPNLLRIELDEEGRAAWIDAEGETDFE